MASFLVLSMELQIGSAMNPPNAVRHIASKVRGFNSKTIRAMSPALSDCLSSSLPFRPISPVVPSRVGTFGGLKPQPSPIYGAASTEQMRSSLGETPVGEYCPDLSAPIGLEHVTEHLPSGNVELDNLIGLSISSVVFSIKERDDIVLKYQISDGCDPGSPLGS